MGKLPRMGKPPFLTPHQVQNDDLLEVVEEPYVKAAEDSKFGRERGYAAVRQASCLLLVSTRQLGIVFSALLAKRVSCGWESVSR